MSVTNCTTDADCAPLLALGGWCVSSVQCWTDSGTCIQWPRCNATPYIGCVASTQECANQRIFEPAATVTSFAVGMFFLLAIALAVSFLFFAVGFNLYWRKEQRPDAEPLWQSTFPEPASLGAALSPTASEGATAAAAVRTHATSEVGSEDRAERLMDPFVF